MHKNHIKIRKLFYNPHYCNISGSSDTVPINKGGLSVGGTNAGVKCGGQVSGGCQLYFILFQYVYRLQTSNRYAPLFLLYTSYVKKRDKISQSAIHFTPTTIYPVFESLATTLSYFEKTWIGERVGVIRMPPKLSLHMYNVYYRCSASSSRITIDWSHFTKFNNFLNTV